MKKLLFLFVLTLLPLSASADAVEINGIYYNLNADAKTAEVTTDDPNSYFGNYSGEIIIPSEITHDGNKYAVTSIGNGTFSFCKLLTSVTIPNSVISIGHHAFESCRRLTSITIPNSVVTIGQDAFTFCEDLSSITIPNSVTSISERAFSYCYSLTSVTIPSSVIFIGDGILESSDGLTSIVVEEGNPKYDSRENCNL